MKQPSGRTPFVSEPQDSRLIRRLEDWDHELFDQLATDYPTPLYVTDLDRVRENYRRIVTAFPDARVMYAAKANTGRAVLRTILEADGTIEGAAQGELRRAIAAGADPNQLHYTAVNPPPADLAYAVDLAADAPGFTITAGAMDTFDRLTERGYDGRVAIRVNPGTGTGHHEKVATGADAKFGIPIDDVESVARNVRERFELVGLHAHIGSGVLGDEIAAHCRVLKAVAEVATAIGDLEFLDIGGGFGVPYREDVAPLDPDDLAKQVRAAVETFPGDLVLEPGRYVVADAALILSHVNTIKSVESTRVVGIDASLATLIRPAMFDAYHPIRNVSAPDREPVPSSVGGPCCTSADVFCTDRPIGRPERGDLLAIGNAGAYGYELANQFHSQPRPADVVLQGDSIRLARRRETIADVTRLEQ